MTSGESTEQTPILKITQDMYASLPTGELVLFAVQHLHADGVPASAEEIVSICFKLFPRRFSLRNYFYWPDSAHVAQALKYAKEKGYIKETAADGYILRPAGRKLARQAAKAMGIPFPMPPKVEKTPEPEPVQIIPPVQPQVEEKKKPAPAKKKKRVKRQTSKAVNKKAETKKPKQAKPAKKSKARRLSAEVTGASSLTPKAKPSAKKVVRKKTPVKKVTVPAKKKTTTKPKAQPKKTVSKPAPKPKTQPKKPVAKPAPKKKAPVRKAVAKKTQAVTQLPLPVPAVPKKEAQKPVVKKKPAAKKIPPKVKQEAKPVVEKIPAVSKEEKAKAGKVIKLVERSDAYRQYKKLGAKARISEFDFRDMLFATMESSAETLKRNVNLFKRYAGIHSRADLITFLDFAEGSFAPLLKIQAKQPARKR
jgi:hypothetical protein